MESINELNMQLRDIEISYLERLGLSRKDAEIAVDAIDYNIDIKEIFDCIECNEKIKKFLIEKKNLNKKAQLVCAINQKKRMEELKEILRL